VAFEAMQGYAGTAPLRSQAAWPGGAYGAVGLAVAPGGSAQAVLAPYEQRPEVEARAAAEFTQVAGADLIRKLYHYLEANGQRYRQLADCIPMVRRAAELYGAGDYTGAFSQAYQAYRGITILRSNTPELPGL
jgi:hypothetical protein